MKNTFVILSQASPEIALMGAKVGLVVGVSIVAFSGIGILINKFQNKKSKWLVRSMIFGACALVTGIINVITLTK